MKHRTAILRQAAVGALVACSLMLAACGGGSASQSGADGGAVTAPTGTAAPSTDTSATTTAWTECADEYGTCTFSGTRKVKYGTGTSAVEGTYTGSVACSNSVFGDPAVGADKSCWVADTTTADATTPVVTTPAVTTPVTTTPVVTAPATGTATGTAAPTFAGAIRPGFVAGTYVAGSAMSIDFGSAANTPQGYDVQLYRSGVAISGASASNVSAFSYTPVSADAGQVISASVVARNSVGSSETAYIPGVSLN